VELCAIEPISVQPAAGVTVALALSKVNCISSRSARTAAATGVMLREFAAVDPVVTELVPLTLIAAHAIGEQKIAHNPKKQHANRNTFLVPIQAKTEKFEPMQRELPKPIFTSGLELKTALEDQISS